VDKQQHAVDVYISIVSMDTIGSSVALRICKNWVGHFALSSL